MTPRHMPNVGCKCAEHNIELHGVQADHVTQLFASAADTHTAVIRSFQQQAADQADSDAQWQRQSSQRVMPPPTPQPPHPPGPRFCPSLPASSPARLPLILLDWLMLQSSALCHVLQELSCAARALQMRTCSSFHL